MKTVKKLIGLLLTFVMVISLCISGSGNTVYAAERIDADGFVTSKNVELQNDGTYKITLEAYATGEEVQTTTIEKIDNDIVLVLDVSGSMADTVVVGKTNKSGLEALDTSAEEGWYEFTWTFLDYVMRYNSETGKWQYQKKVIGRNDWQNFGEGILGTIVGWSAADVKIQKINALKLSAKKFINEIAADGADHNISIVKFAGDAYYSGNHLAEGNHTYTESKNEYNYTELVKNFRTSTDSANISELISAVYSLKEGGATSADYGMTIAQEVLNQDSYKANGNNKVVVMFTDGEVTHNKNFETTVANNAIKVAYQMKKDNNATIYTVGLYAKESSNQTTFMNAVSSNYPDASSMTKKGNQASDKYYMTANTAEGLDDIFGTIAKETVSGGSTVTADATTVVKDIISDEFTISSSSTVNTYTVNVNNSASKSADGVVFETAMTPVNLTVDSSDNTVKVKGFDFAANWCGKDGSNNYRGKKLVIEISGIIPKDEAFTGEAIATNATGSAVFAEDEIHAIEEFEKPAVTLNEKAVVIDYAKPVQIETGVSKFLVNNALSTAAPAMTFGSLALNNGTLTYAPTTTSWTGEDVVYTFSSDWNKTAIKPASNIYYEDTFKGTSGSNASITYTGSWTKGNAGDNAGSTNADGVDGWIEALETEHGYTDGSATTVNVKDGNATATIYFTGTGIDVYTQTNDKAGVVIAKLSAVDSGTGIKTKMTRVYNESVSGNYYSVPTLSFNDLAYADYKLVITVTKDALTTDKGQFNYCIDGIRIYNPSEENKAAYKALDTLLTSGSKVFVDENRAVTSAEEAIAAGTIAQNEIYLAKGASVSISVSGGDEYFMGMKSLTGQQVTAEFTKGSAEKSVAAISHTGDMYYKVTPVDGVITVKNAGDNVLALTKLQITGSGAAAASVTPIEGEQAAVFSARMSSFAPVAYSLNPVVEEEISQPETEVEAPVVDITEPEETVQPEAPVQNESILSKLFSGFKKIFGR